MRVEAVADIRVVHAVESSRLRSRQGCLLKRLLDLSLAVPIAIFILMLCPIVKLGQLLQSAGPLFYRQTRSGKDGKPFTILKFRTMHVTPPGTTDTEEDLERRTYPIGRFLRRSKIDEIPQFVNVLLGSMSVVGPRPHHYEDCKNFAQQASAYPLRSIAKPGITGMAQIAEHCGDFEWNCVESRVECDLSYIVNWSLRLDIQLIFKTASILPLGIVDRKAPNAAELNAAVRRANRAA